MNLDIYKGFVKGYDNDDKYKALIEAILKTEPITKDGENIFSRRGYLFIVKNGLLYYVSVDKTYRLCILKSIV